MNTKDKQCLLFRMKHLFRLSRRLSPRRRRRARHCFILLHFFLWKSQWNTSAHSSSNSNRVAVVVAFIHKVRVSLQATRSVARSVGKTGWRRALNLNFVCFTGALSWRQDKNWIVIPWKGKFFWFCAAMEDGWQCWAVAAKSCLLNCELLNWDRLTFCLHLQMKLCAGMGNREWPNGLTTWIRTLSFTASTGRNLPFQWNGSKC